MSRAVFQLLLAFVLFIGGALDTHAAKRVALVIGNSAYEHATVLKNPKTDAESIAGLLGRLGFDVVTGTDLNVRGFADAVNLFAEKLRGAEVALFYYAGHGLQVHGRNYLAPIDARLKHQAGLEFEAVRLRTILALMEEQRRVNLVFLDACRDNPLARTLARNMGTRSAAVGRGWAREEAGVGTLISFATQPGNVALDGDGQHSPFAQSLLKHAETPGLEIEGVMRRVRRDVIAATNGAQIPWDHSSLTAPFLFRKKPATAGDASPSTQQPYNPKATQLAFWQSIGSSKNAALYAEYLRQYPNGDFSIIAKTKLDELKATQQKPRKEKVATLPIASSTAQPEYSNRRELTLALQKELKRVGCNPGTIDGYWGGKGRNALALFNRYAKLNLSTGEPTLDTLNAIKKKTTTVCPVRKACGNGKVLDKAGRCIVRKDRQNKSKTTHLKKNSNWRCESHKKCNFYCRKYKLAGSFLSKCFSDCRRLYPC